MTETPARNTQHEALNVFLGKWTARGTSYGGTDQSGDDPKANGEPWVSTHEGAWHTGSFFLVQDERADIAESRFDTLSVLGVDAETGKYFARSFENHGFYRHYQIDRVGDVWTLTGDTERATTTFVDKGRTQKIVWEWKRDGVWLPLCDRTAVRID
jgi:hypothetical protein